MQSEIQAQAEALSAEQNESEQTQKTNLEEKSHSKHHHVSKANLCTNNSFAHWIAIHVRQIMFIFYVLS